MLLSDWLLLGFACFSAALSPGPSLALLFNVVLHSGRFAGIVFAFAHGIGILFYAALVALGIAAVLLVWQGALLILQIVGFLFLFFVGAMMIRGGFRSRRRHASPLHSAPLNSTPLASSGYFGGHFWRPARDGFLIVFLNPKVAAFFLGIFAPFLALDDGFVTRLGMVSLSWIIDTFSYGMMAIILTIPQVFRFLQKHQPLFEIAIGCILLLLALGLAYRLVFFL